MSVNENSGSRVAAIKAHTAVVAGNVLLVLLMSHAVIHISEIQLITSS